MKTPEKDQRQFHFTDFIGHLPEPGRPAEGFLCMLNDLEGLSGLFRVREETRLNQLAGVKKDLSELNVPLKNQFVVLGRFLMTPEGVFLIDPLPRERFPLLPKALSAKEFGRLVCEHYQIKKLPIWPNEKVICPVCGQGWSLENCHRFKFLAHPKIVPMKTVGRNFWESINSLFSPWETLDARKKEEREKRMARLDPDCIIVRPNGHKIKLPRHDYIIETGDKACLQVFQLFHPDCFRQYKLQQAAEKILEICAEAGLARPEIELLRKSPAGKTWRLHHPLGSIQIFETEPEELFALTLPDSVVASASPLIKLANRPYIKQNRSALVATLRELAGTHH